MRLHERAKGGGAERCLEGVTRPNRGKGRNERGFWCQAILCVLTSLDAGCWRCQHPNSMDDEFRIPLERRLITLHGHREGLQDQLREAHHELNSVDRRIEAAEELYRREFESEPPISVSGPDGRRATRIRRAEGQLPWRDAVVDVLSTAGKPLHAREIWQRLRDSGFQSEAADPVRSVVATAIRSEVQIHRTGPNTFALNGIEHDDRQLRVDSDVDAPVPAP